MAAYDIDYKYDKNKNSQVGLYSSEYFLMHSILLLKIVPYPLY